MTFRVFVIAAASLALTACAFGDEKLNLAYDASAAKAGVLSEAQPATVAVKDVTDDRVERNAIGYKRNGFGAKTADILSVKPAPELVKEALVATLEKNGHKIGGDGDRYAIDTKLRKFWFDYKTGLVTVEFFGNVQAEIAVVDQQTGETLYSEIFEGYHSEKTGGGLSKTWTRIMNAALADLANKVNLSPGFMEALAKVSASQSPPAVSAAPAAVDKTGA
jgi:ABC-type uncharacterized transport system auxiliary subunit